MSRRPRIFGVEDKKMTVVTNSGIYLLLVLTTVLSRILGDLKICTTVDCPNEHIEVQNDVDGAIFRYSENAANFHEAKVAPSPTKVMHHKTHGKHLNSKARATTQRQHSTAAGGHVFHQQPHVSVLGEGGGSQRNQRWQHTPYVNEPQLLPHLSTNHLQQQQHRQRQHQQQRKQLNPIHLQHSSTKDPSGYISASGGKQQGNPTVTGRARAVEDGIFWSATVEGAIPPGLSDAAAEAWKKRIRQLRVVKVENASLDKCGSSMNRHVVFDDGTTACARYRHPLIQFVLGDLYCYYLARMLGMQNVPTIVFSHVSNDSSSQWSSVAADISLAGWQNNTTASFSLWINDLAKSYLPEIMFNNHRETIYPWTAGLADLNTTELVELAQYSDLIVFDYITAHLDRMTIRKNAVEYYQQDWLYGGEVHNLAKHKTNGGLWFIDNENGIFNAYFTIYSPRHKDQMMVYHEELLRSFCIFRRSTYNKIHELASMEDPFEALDRLVHDQEPVDVTDDNRHLFFKVNERFKERLSNVVTWMDTCQSRSRD